MSFESVVAILALISLVIVKYGLIDQIRLNRRNQSTGTLPYDYYALGMLSYMYTVWQAALVGDEVTAGAQMLGVLLFAIILGQFYQYMPAMYGAHHGVCVGLLATYVWTVVCYFTLPVNALQVALAFMSLGVGAFLKASTLKAIISHWESRSTKGLSGMYISLTLLSYGFGGLQSQISGDSAVAVNQWGTLVLSLVILWQMVRYRGRTPLQTPRNSNRHPLLRSVKGAFATMDFILQEQRRIYATAVALMFGVVVAAVAHQVLGW